MKKHLIILASVMTLNGLQAQQPLTPEKLWELHRVSAIALTPDQQYVLVSVSTPNVKENTFNKEYYKLAVKGGVPIPISKEEVEKFTTKYNTDKSLKLTHKEVKLKSVLGKDFYADLDKSSGKLYSSLDHRHWDTWNEGSYNHVMIEDSNGKQTDIMEGLPYYCPQLPFGGDEDYIWSLDGKKVLYVTKAKVGTDYVLSTNTDIYEYDLASKKTTNLTEGMMGYDTHPMFSPDGNYLAWLSMARDGYEADKNDIYIMPWHSKAKANLTQNWDDSVTGDTFWANDSKSIFFTAAYRGTKQLFSVNTSKAVKQITKGNFDVNNIFAQNKNTLLVTRNDAFHSPELYSVELKSGKMKQTTDINKDFYQKLSLGHSELKMVKTSDGKEMGVWFHYPPNFDPNKKYPTLLYCQGGPQSALTPYFSLRWNFSLMTANGYIVVAPNRRGMPGWGTKWNEQISQDWGGQPIQDYLSATDFAKTLPYVDGNRMGAVGASYGGYSVLMLAGVHQNRFKTFISHNGLFDMKSWYGTTEELWFANWDLGSSPWENPNATAYTKFSPSNYIKKWNTPIMIIQGGLDFRVPYEQGQQAFQSARLRNLKAKFLYFPDENHWVLKPQNALVWQREFFEWLKETL